MRVLDSRDTGHHIKARQRKREKGSSNQERIQELIVS